MELEAGMTPSKLGRGMGMGAVFQLRCSGTHRETRDPGGAEFTEFR